MASPSAPKKIVLQRYVSHMRKYTLSGEREGVKCVLLGLIGEGNGFFPFLNDSPSEQPFEVSFDTVFRLHQENNRSHIYL